MIFQTQYIENILQKYNLHEANSVGMLLELHIKLDPQNNTFGKHYDSNYGSLIGSLVYAAVAT